MQSEIIDFSAQFEKLSPEAKQGYEWAVEDVKKYLLKEKSPEKALAKIGVKDFQDTLWFLAYVQTYHPKLYKKLTK